MNIDNYHQFEPLAEVEQTLPPWLRMLSVILAVPIACSALAMGAAGLMSFMLFDGPLSPRAAALVWMIIGCYYFLVLKLAIISVPLMETACPGRLSKLFIHSGIAALITLMTPDARLCELSVQKRFFLGVLVIPLIFLAGTFGYLAFGTGVLLGYRVAILVFVAEMAATAAYYAYCAFIGRELQDLSNLSLGASGSYHSQVDPRDDYL